MMGGGTTKRPGYDYPYYHRSPLHPRVYVCMYVVYCVNRSLFFPFIYAFLCNAFPSHTLCCFVTKSFFLFSSFRYTHISFSNRKVLWEGYTIIERLASISNKTDDDDRSSPHIPPSMAAIQTWQRVIVALLKPGSDFGYVRNAGTTDTHTAVYVCCVCVCEREFVRFHTTTTLLHTRHTTL